VGAGGLRDTGQGAGRPGGTSPLDIPGLGPRPGLGPGLNPPIGVVAGGTDHIPAVLCQTDEGIMAAGYVKL
jgi:hypothetical protein